ncbi:MAG: phytoene desaturase family protein [Dehalococcoidia bacterium]
MPDASYDAVIVGASHNALTLAAYLARAGMSVAVFERRHEDGGCAHTDTEVTVPGFHHNLHAQYMEFIEYMPIWEDFDLPKHGARVIKPEVQLGITFADGRPPIILWLPEHMDKTYESIARYSKHDAEVWREIKTKVMQHDKLLAAFLYTPPDTQLSGGPAARLERMQQFWSLFGLPTTYQNKTPKVIIDELFETPELRALLYRQTPEWGSDTYAGNGWSFLFSTVWMAGIHYLSVGGTHTLFHAMANAALSEGVALRFNRPVVKVNIKNNRATGVILADGSEIEARKVVISGADPLTTWFELIGEENLSPMRQERMAGWEFGPHMVLATPSLALHEPPDYKSAKHDPAINKCFYTVVGFESPEDVTEYMLEGYGGKIPEIPGAGTWVNTLWDPTQAPPGKHAMNGWFFFPKASCLTPEEWREVKDTYMERFRALLQKYAPNMTKKNVIAMALYTPYDQELTMKLPEGDFSHGHPASGGFFSRRKYWYRTEIDGFYQCSAAVGGAGISTAGGYACFKTICEDYELPRIWEKPGRIY